jgi:hypothetical protein
MKRFHSSRSDKINNIILIVIWKTCLEMYISRVKKREKLLIVKKIWKIYSEKKTKYFTHLKQSILDKLLISIKNPIEIAYVK